MTDHLPASREKPSIPSVLGRFRAYHEKHLVWGALHIVLDDGNIGDDSVQFCLDFAVESGDTDGAALARILLSMSKTQRKKLGRMA